QEIKTQVLSTVWDITLYEIPILQSVNNTLTTVLSCYLPLTIAEKEIY
ncbi:21684_t:CDS:1, partial [Racocetra persica]